MSTNGASEGVPASGLLKRPAGDDDDAATTPGGVIKPPKSASSNKRTKKKNMDPAILQFRVCVQQCCKRDDLATALTAYDRAVSADTRIEAQSFYSLLNLLCCHDGRRADRGIHVGTPYNSNKTASSLPKDIAPATKMKGKDGTTAPIKEGDAGTIESPATAATAVVIDDGTRRNFAERLKQHMDDLKLPLTENAYTALVRFFCRTNDVAEAERVLNEAETTQQCKVKLRLYSPLLTTYCEAGHLVMAVSTWHRLSARGLVLTELEYCALMKCCSKTGDAAVLERVLSDLAEDVLVPCHETAKAVVEWFESPHAVLPTASVALGDESARTTTKELLEKIHVPYAQKVTTMGPVKCCDDAGGWTVSHRCTVDTETGKLLTGCLEGASLQPILLCEDAWQEMKRMNEAIAVTGKLSEGDTVDYQGGGKGRKITVDEKAVAERQFHWKAFQDYLAHQRPVDVVIDGANVGFFDQNFAGSPKHVDYSQIDWVVQHFLRMNKSVLLVMHSRHFSRNLMPSSAEPLMRKWLDTGVLYRTPPGMNDDWFWLHAALHFGPGTLVVTNDEMRDHHFQMVAPRSFLRWRDRHQIHFDVGGWKKDGQGRSIGREVILTYPDPYSRRIQRVLDGLVIPLPKRGDTNRFLDGEFVAESEPEEETYLCIRPKSSSVVDASK